jgi:predicted DNA binding CopG/RHH family protein
MKAADKEIEIMKNKIPAFKTDAEAEHFVDIANLSEYDLASFKPIQLEFEKSKLSPNIK